MFKKWVLGCALVVVCASVQAEITARHSYMRANMTIERDEVYEVLGRVSRLPFEGLRVDAETIKEVTK